MSTQGLSINVKFFTIKPQHVKWPLDTSANSIIILKHESVKSDLGLDFTLQPSLCAAAVHVSCEE